MKNIKKNTTVVSKSPTKEENAVTRQGQANGDAFPHGGDAKDGPGFGGGGWGGHGAGGGGFGGGGAGFGGGGGGGGAGGGGWGGDGWGGGGGGAPPAPWVGGGGWGGGGFGAGGGGAAFPGGPGGGGFGAGKSLLRKSLDIIENFRAFSIHQDNLDHFQLKVFVFFSLPLFNRFSVIWLIKLLNQT